MFNDEQLSRAVSLFQSEMDLLYVLEKVKKVHGIEIPVDKALSVWKDIRRAPKSRALTY